MKKVEQILKETGTYYLATTDGDQPRVRPFGTIHIYEDKLYIQTSKVKDVSRQIHANPKVEICAFKNGEWVRVAGELVEDARRETRQSMLDAYPELQTMYSADDGNTEVFYIKNATATFSSFTKAPEVVKFQRMREKVKEEEPTNMTNKELTKIREEKNMTKGQFAALIGISPMMQGRYEGGKVKIPEDIAAKVMKWGEEKKDKKVEQKATRKKAEKN